VAVHSILAKNGGSLRAPLNYSSLAGICFGCYLITWMGTPLFVIILLIYILIEYTINHLRGEDEDSNPLFIITMPVFVIPAAMIAMPVVLLWVPFSVPYHNPYPCTTGSNNKYHNRGCQSL